MQTRTDLSEVTPEQTRRVRKHYPTGFYFNRGHRLGVLRPSRNGMEEWVSRESAASQPPFTLTTSVPQFLYYDDDDDDDDDCTLQVAT